MVREPGGEAAMKAGNSECPWGQALPQPGSASLVPFLCGSAGKGQD